MCRNCFPPHPQMTLFGQGTGECNKCLPGCSKCFGVLSCMQCSSQSLILFAYSNKTSMQGFPLAEAVRSRQDASWMHENEVLTLCMPSIQFLLFGSTNNEDFAAQMIQELYDGLLSGNMDAQIQSWLNFFTESLGSRTTEDGSVTSIPHLLLGSEFRDAVKQ